MTDIMDKTRLLVAKRHDEEIPMVIAAMPESTWEVTGPEDWDEWANARAKQSFDRDWMAYDYIEVVVTIPNAQLAEMFTAREITPTSLEQASS